MVILTFGNFCSGEIYDIWVMPVIVIVSIFGSPAKERKKERKGILKRGGWVIDDT